MRIKKHVKLKPLVLIVISILIIVFPIVLHANSMEPPSLIIIIQNPSEDLSIEMVTNEKYKGSSYRRVAWEGYYAFYSMDMKDSGKYTFNVISNGESFQCELKLEEQEYRNIVTLDMKNKKIILGKYPLRSFILVSIRVLLTLLIEGFIFLLFKYREKKSWRIFFIINLITQGILNIWLNSMDLIMTSYPFFPLIFGEIFVFLAEIIGFTIFIDEYKKSRVLLYVLLANIVSLIAGIFIISILPI